MTTKELRREKRLRLIGEAIERWQVKLEKADRTTHRAIKMITKLERQKRAIERHALLIPILGPTATQVESTPVEFVDQPGISPPIPAPAPRAAPAAIDDIPGFLQRSQANADRDKADAEAVRAEMDADKKRKAELSAEKRKVKQEVRDADLTGLRRKMPLTGRAALDALK